MIFNRKGEHMEFVKIEKEGKIALITIERPKALNALNDQVLGELMDTVEALETDREISCVIITGSGEKAFVLPQERPRVSQERHAG